MFWEVKSLGNGFWSITNRASGKCLEMCKEKPVRWQSLFRDGALEQQWRFEAVADSRVEGDKHKAVSPEPRAHSTAKTPADERTVRVLDSDRLAIGDTGTIGCAYAQILKIIDDHSCVAVPYTYEQVTDYTGGDPIHGNQYVVSSGDEPHLPIVLKGWPTAGKVTGQKEDLSKAVFRVTGTEDVKKKDGEVVRVHVLELVK